MFTAFASANAVIAYPHPINVTQPDGTVITIQLHGDEYLNWVTCGNSLVEKGDDGYWHYTSFDANTGNKVQGARVIATPAGDGSLVTPPAQLVEKALMQRKQNTRTAKNASGNSISLGAKRFLILLIEFSDKSFTMGKEDFTGLLNSDNYSYNGAVGSVNKYYKEISFGKFNPIFDVYGPIRVSGTSAEYAADDVDAVIEACNYANEYLGVDFTKYCNRDKSLVDNVFFFFPGHNRAEGGGADTIWPHAVTYGGPFLKLDGVGIYQYGCTSEFKGSSGEVMAGIGTFCHEFGHVIGLPDFYDVDYETNGSANALGTLSLMSSGNYNNEGRTPPYFTYEEKLILGWNDALIKLDSGNNSLMKTSMNKSYYIPTSNEGEYFLFESRPNDGWDRYTGTSGLAIYHVDKSNNMLPDGMTARAHFENKYNINAFAAHQCMDLIETVPESQIQYTNQYTFPGPEGRTEFTSTSTPAQSAWDGSATGYDLTDINFNYSNGKTSVNVGKVTKITGYVRDYDGMPIPGAEITATLRNATETVIGSGAGTMKVLSLKNVPGATEYRATSAGDGSFEFNVSEAGNYSVKVTKFGYVDYTTSVQVDAVSNIYVCLALPKDLLGTELRKYSLYENNVLGFGAGVDCYAGLKYTADELAPYVGSSISSISFQAYKSANDTYGKVGVKVYFGDECVYDAECKDVFFNSIYTRNIEDAGLKIPDGKDVTFVYYILNPSCAYSIALADKDNAVEGGNLVNRNDGLQWTMISANVVMSATIIQKNEVFNLSGFNYIPHAASYRAGATFELKLVESSVRRPSSVSWTVNGQAASGSVILSAGTTVVRAHIEYGNGRTEIVEVCLKVLE